MESPLCPPTDPGFRLIETFLWVPGKGIRHAERHMARLRRSAEGLGIIPRNVEEVLQEISGCYCQRVRLTVNAAGKAEATTQPFTPLARDTIWRIGIEDARLQSHDPWLRVKTTEQGLYDRARLAMPDTLDELVFMNENNNICEGTITSIFVDTGQGMLTPPISCGVLPGVLREALLETGQVCEAVLSLNDLKRAKAIYVGNSLRGLIPARLVSTGIG